MDAKDKNDKIPLDLSEFNPRNKGNFMNEFIAYLIKNLVDEPDSVQVQLLENEKGTTIEVRVSQADVAKVVGRQGKTIHSLRTIAMTIGARFGKRVRLELLQ
jgi:predicted RNA-binding protein YlqC (UPF0109 family)